MPSQRALYSAMTFFSLTAVVVVALRRPFDLVGWACLVACIGFVALGCLAIVKPDIAAGRRRHKTAAAGGFPAAFEHGHDTNEALAPEPGKEATVGEPSDNEPEVLKQTVSALEAVGATTPGEIDTTTLWVAAQRMDPGQAIGVHEALAALSDLHDAGQGQIGRLIFVPAHTEYDRSLIAEIVAATLAAFGHDIRPTDIGVELPPGGGEGTATISFPLADRIERVTCHYRWKYPPDDLLPALVRFTKPEAPRDLVCADPGDQTLLYAAIRAGALDELNHQLPGDQDLFDKVEPVAKTAGTA
ncbi:hypothetical protein FXN63_26225 [Pigmentiphaga aceris]|uniref:Uncharacterized protein n=1 Tax=Pigmentiphaga aceris TaxID=1940612 RepID=A0A5C0B519_9BURK|nr:hypothetical protein [Pigmentiphaga aceris]QEI08956.1 hypothetical protein FXN63_26225 [Pigmentiphaga aceris]